MTLQWTAVASFLYTEIAVILLLCIPFISAQRWQKIFNFQFWGKIATYWNRAFLAIIVILVVLFLDAVREVRKYSAVHTVNTDSKQFPNAYDHVHMKLFRAQRNLYISGFSLFLWLALRRLITLITQLASADGNSDALKCQAESSSDAAKKCMEENEAIKRAMNRGKSDDQRILCNENAELHKHIQKLQDEIKKNAEALRKSQSEVHAVKKQSDGLSREYDRLIQEHADLQKRVDKLDKKGH
ncbi:B-cell receptor-associated protein 29 [Protopterus annectens]|uniref:B-cell receptor-associated protein 29 n=1 Tax=Protopterus annectens TaxID=7888 RepID=UPI001CF9DF2B|nr:B-cell receptor-associated protein 29 [Protopterus annectens]XP_043944487.1 B-cell receptor-associated protein 29 [Protopterus annectens]